MDHTRLSATTTTTTITRTQHNPTNPYPLPDPYASLYGTNYTYLPHHLTTPNPNPNLLRPHELYGATVGVHPSSNLYPPGVDSYAYLHPHQAHSAGVEAYSYPTVDDGSMAAPTAYYQDPNAQNWATVIEAVRQYGTDPVAYGSAVTIPPNGTDQSVAAIPNPTLWTNPAVRPHGKGTWKRVLKKTKIVQSLYCEICKVDCSSKVVYEHHVLGKRHKKNMEKVIEGVAPPSASAVSNHSVIGPQEKAVSGQQTKNKASDSVQNLETKRRKVLEGGAAAHAVRSCTICNVVCNSDTVFSHHLSGQKHAAMVKKYSTSTRIPTAI